MESVSLRALTIVECRYIAERSMMPIFRRDQHPEAFDVLFERWRLTLFSKKHAAEHEAFRNAHPNLAHCLMELKNVRVQLDKVQPKLTIDLRHLVFDLFLDALIQHHRVPETVKNSVDRYLEDDSSRYWSYLSFLGIQSALLKPMQKAERVYLKHAAEITQNNKYPNILLALNYFYPTTPGRVYYSPASQFQETTRCAVDELVKHVLLELQRVPELRLDRIVAMIDTIDKAAQLAQAEPETNAGADAAGAMSSHLMQSSFDTFHAAGSLSGSTANVVRMNDLLAVGRKPHDALTTVHFKNKDITFQEAYDYATSYEEITLHRLLVKQGYQMHQQTLDELDWFVKMELQENNYELQPNQRLWILRLRLQPKELYARKIPVSYVVDRLKAPENKLANANLLFCASDSKTAQIIILSMSTDNRMQVEQLNQLKKQLTLNVIHISGIPDIELFNIIDIYNGKKKSRLDYCTRYSVLFDNIIMEHIAEKSNPIVTMDVDDVSTPSIGDSPIVTTGPIAPKEEKSIIWQIFYNRCNLLQSSIPVEDIHLFFKVAGCSVYLPKNSEGVHFNKVTGDYFFVATDNATVSPLASVSQVHRLILQKLKVAQEKTYQGQPILLDQVLTNALENITETVLDQTVVDEYIRFFQHATPKESLDFINKLNYFHLLTLGVNFPAFCLRPEVDPYCLVSGFVREVMAALGTEAARTSHIMSFLNLLNPGGSRKVNPHHVELLVDLMTMHGGIITPSTSSNILEQFSNSDPAAAVSKVTSEMTVPGNNQAFQNYFGTDVNQTIAILPTQEYLRDLQRHKKEQRELIELLTNPTEAVAAPRKPTVDIDIFQTDQEPDLNEDELLDMLLDDTAPAPFVQPPPLQPTIPLHGTPNISVNARSLAANLFDW